jgi:hypothetical protein
MSIYTQNGIIYTGGQITFSGGGDTKSCYWTNDNMQILDGFIIYSICLYKGNLHCSGENNNAPQGEYWKNQEYSKIMDVDDVPYAITISNDNIYMAGMYTSPCVPCYWINLNRYPLSVPSGAVAVYNDGYSLLVRETTK